MTISEWNERYRARTRPQDFDPEPTPLVVEIAEQLPQGRALDLACGAGRNALWLAQRRWTVKAVDGSEAAIETLRFSADRLDLSIETGVADLTGGEFHIEEGHWDLVLMCYYLQRDLLEPAKRGVAPGGTVVAIAHTPRPGEEASATRARPRELRSYFDDWQIVHYYEGESRDAAHHRPVAEIAARRPG